MGGLQCKPVRNVLINGWLFVLNGDKKGMRRGSQPYAGPDSKRIFMTRTFSKPRTACYGQPQPGMLQWAGGHDSAKRSGRVVVVNGDTVTPG